MENATGFPTISLKAARVNAGLTIQEAAKALGICRNTLMNYECGKSTPGVKMAQKIEDLYKFPLRYIFFPDV